MLPPLTCTLFTLGAPRSLVRIATPFCQEPQEKHYAQNLQKIFSEPRSGEEYEQKGS